MPRLPSNTHSTATGHSRWAEDCECEYWAALDSGDESMSVGVRTCLVSHNMDPQLGSPRPGGDSLHGRELKVFKILILGDSGTGKTALVRRSVHDFFTEGYRSTIGVDFSLKVSVVQLNLAGHRNFHEYCNASNYGKAVLSKIKVELNLLKKLGLKVNIGCAADDTVQLTAQYHKRLT